MLAAKMLLDALPRTAGEALWGLPRGSRKVRTCGTFHWFLGTIKPNICNLNRLQRSPSWKTKGIWS